MDQLHGGFVEEASNWRSLASLIAGGLAYRLGHWGFSASQLVQPALARPLAPLFGLASEVTAYRSTQYAMQSASVETKSNAPFEIGWMADYLRFGLLKLAAGQAPVGNPLLSHSLQDAGLVFGEHLAHRLGLAPAPQGSWAQQTLHAEAVTLQIGAGMGLAHWATGGKLLQVEGFLKTQQESTIEAPAYRRLKLAENHLGSFAARGSGEADGIRDSTERQLWIEHWKPRFPALPSAENYSDEIIAAVLDTPFPKLTHYANLLRAYAQSTQAGTLKQLYVAKAVQSLLSEHPHTTPTGSFDRVLLHFLLQEGVSEHPQLVEGRLGKILDAMEEGIDRKRTVALLEEFGYSDGLALPGPGEVLVDADLLMATEFLHEAYLPDEQSMIRYFISARAGNQPHLARRMAAIFVEAKEKGAYPATDIHKALTYAQRHPLGMLVLQRIYQIFAVQDSAYKLREIVEGNSSIDDMSNITPLLRSGVDPQLLAHLINGTRATGFIQDERLARKLVSVMMDVGEALHQPQQRQEAKRKIIAGIMDFLREGRELRPEDLLNILDMNPSVQIDRLLQAWVERRFVIEIVGAEEFNSIVQSLHAPADCHIALFEPRESPQKDRILIKGLPALDLESPQGRQQALREMFVRLISVVHEWEHWRHSTGNYQGIEAGARPLLFPSLNRQARVTAEIMAYLEEERWRNLNLDVDTWHTAQAMGENLVMHLRSRADASYYLGVNRRLMEKMKASAEGR